MVAETALFSDAARRTVQGEPRPFVPICRVPESREEYDALFKERPRCEDLSTIIVHLDMRWVAKHLGEECVVRMFQGLPQPLEFWQDPHNWFDIRESEVIVLNLQRMTGDPDIVARIHREWWELEAFPSIQRLVVLLSNDPRLVYREVTTHARKLNRHRRYHVEFVSRNSAVITAEFVDPWYRQFTQCVSEHAIFESVPTVWGLPPAEVDHRRCYLRGDEVCEFRVSWTEKRFLRNVCDLTLGKLRLMKDARRELERSYAELQRQHRELLVAQQRETRLRKAFQVYVPREDLVRIFASELELPTLGGVETEQTILFSDLVGFSSISEGLSPLATVEWLNEYFEAMTEIIHDHGGAVDKYIGDAIMARFSSGEAAQALRCALKMQEELVGFNSGRRAPTRAGIGINTGPVVLGNIGSTVRMDFTAIGDAVNVAQRIEALTRKVPHPILLSDSTAAAVNGTIPVAEVGEFEVKGRARPVKIFRPCLVDAPTPHTR